MENLKYIIESLLFVADEPLTMERFKKIIAPAETQEIRAALSALAAEYEERSGGFFLDEVAGGYQIRTRPEYTEWIKKLIQPRPLRLSKAALETLVIIAYKQPIIRSDIEHLRGVDCGGVLRVLLERKLIRVLGRREIAGRPLIYATTKHFLEVFDLKTLKDLPTPREIEELGASLAESGKSMVFETDAESDEEEEMTEAYDAEMDASEDPEAAPHPPEEYEPEGDASPPGYAAPSPDAEPETGGSTLWEDEVENPEAEPTENKREDQL
ncbi:MAG: SMC-Scp complex subunit ScpB [Desulfobacterales bacterium]|jgi:segregation and condensation protein B